MAVFADLPVELIVKILFETQPLDLISFAAASKQIHFLATPVLQEDRDLQKEYKSIAVLPCANHGFEEHQLARLLITIDRNPRAALHIVNLEIAKYYNKWDYGYHTPYPPPMFEQLENLLRKTRMIPAQEVSDWIVATHEGDEDPLLALLLLHLPNLRKISYVCGGIIDQGRILKTIQRIAEAERQSYLLLLKEVHVINYSIWEERIRHLPYAFMSLPSVQSFGAESLYDHQSHPESKDLHDHHRSQLQDFCVEDLTFTECYLGTEHLCGLIERTRCLKSLIWQTSEVGNATPIFDPSCLMRSLAANAGRTLERLTLALENYTATSVGSLDELQALREVDMDIAMMFGLDGNDILTWPNRLPRTLEKLSLNLMDDHVVQTPENFCKAFRCLLRVRKERYPNLKYICIRMKSEDQCRRAYDHIQHPFSAAGIYLRHDHPSGGGHMDPGCGDCSDCNPVVERFLHESGGPEAYSAMGCCSS